MPSQPPFRDSATRDYLKRQQQQSDALMQQSRQNAEDSTRQANEAQRQQEQQARESERQQASQQKETLRAQNVATEADLQARNQPQYTGSDGVIRPQQDRETFDREQAAKNQAKADALRFQQEGRKFAKNPIDGSTIPLQSDAAVEAARQAKAEAARRSVIDRNLQALKTEADDPALASAALTESARKQAERALTKKRDEARYALQAKLGQQATAKTGTADWVPFNENPTPEAQAAAERLKRLEDPNADLDDDDLALLDADPTTASTAAAVRNLKTRLAQADEAGQKITSAKTRIWEEEMRRDNPEKYREIQRQKLLADPTAIEGAAQDFEARKAALETNAAEIAAQRDQTRQQIADIEALNTQRMAEGVPATDLIQMAGPDGQPQPWSKELAAQRAALEAQAQAWEGEQEPRLLELQAEEEDLKATAALINEAQQGRQQQAEAQRQQTFASLAQQPGGKTLVANLTALDAERAQRVADLQKLPEGSPERQAAEATLQGDLAAKAQQVQEAHAAERGAAAKFYAYLKEFDPNTDWTKPDRSLDQVLRNASAKSGIDPETAKQYLPSLAERDWTAGDTKATSRVTSDGQLLINPTLASDAEAYKKAVESAKATPEAKQAALDQLPAAEKDLAAAALPILAVQEDNPLFARNAAAFVKALENPTAAARLLQGSLTGMADTLPSFNQFVEIVSEKQPDFAAKSPADQAAAYLRMTKGRGVLSKYQDQILSGLINGTAAIPQQIAGAVAALTGNESAANVAATLSQNAQIDQQRLALTGANNAPGAQLAGSLASTVPSLAVAFAGGMVGQTFGRVGVALRAASKGDDIVGALTQGSAALYQQAAGVAGSSVAGGLQSLGGFYADAYQTFRERGQDHLTAHQNAAAPAMLAGMGTALLTLAGGATGVEKVFAAKGGADAVKAAVRTRWQAIMGGIVKEAGSEGLEEGFDQLWQGFLDQAAVNPSKTVKEIFAEALEAGAIGGILGGAIGGIQAATEAAPVTPAAPPNPANLPETVAAAEEAIDALDLPELDPQTVARTQESARALLYLAQGTPLSDIQDFPEGQKILSDLDLVEDPKNPGQFINGKIIGGKNGETKLVTYTNGQVSDPATGALRPVRVRIENGQPIISQTTLDKLETILPAVRAAIPLNETDRKNQVRTPAPTVQPPADAQETGIQSPSGSGNTQAPSNQNAGTAAPIAEESSVVDPAATERTNQLSLHLAELGLPPAQAETVAQAMVAKRGVVGTEYVEQVTSKEFIADLKALGISGSLSSVKAKENPLKAGPDLAQRLATYSPSAQSAPVETPAAIPPVTTAPTSDSSITAQGAAATAQGVVDIPQGEAKAAPAVASPDPVSGIDADAYLAARQAAMKAVPVAKRKDAVKLLGALDKAINRYGSAFTGVRFVTTPGGGLAVNRAGGKTYLDIDLGQWVSQHTNLVDKAGVVALTELEEEFIHRAASAVFTDADMSGFFRGLPADLQRMVYKGYHVADIASKAMPAEPPAEFEDSKAVQLGHEFLRMLVQDSTFNGRVSEAIAADPGLGEKIIAFLQKLVFNLRKLIDKADTDTRVTIAEYEKRVTNEVNRLKKLLPDPLKAKETPTNLADTQDNRASVSSSPSPQVSSSPSLAPILGATYTAYTDANDPIEVQYAVVDVNSLVLSNEDDGRINPAYPQELQPRDRTSAGSEAQVADIAKNFNLDRLSASNGVGDGAPIIGPDGVVESGNGRGMGARRAYATGKPSAKAYRETLLTRAPEFGLNAEQVEAVQNPVLVRIRRTDVNRPAFVLTANVSTIAPKRDIEQAKIDAGQIVPDLFESYVPSEDGDIFTAANAEFIKGYISTVIPPAERPAVIDARGNLSQAGLRRIRNALFVHAYGKSPEALNALARLTESVDAADTNIARALIALAPRFGEQNTRIAAGALQPLSITEELTAALQILSDLKNRGEKVTDWLAQDRIPGIGEDPGPMGTALVEYLHENRQRPRQIIEALSRYASAVDAAGDPRQMSMFGDEKPTKQEIWTLAGKPETKQTALAKGTVSPAQDAAYMAAVEAGDMETAQAMVDKSAQAAGYTHLMYHGTHGVDAERAKRELQQWNATHTKMLQLWERAPHYYEGTGKGDFSVFEGRAGMFFFSRNKDFARQFMANWDSDEATKVSPAPYGPGRMINAWIKAENVFDYNKPEHLAQINDVVKYKVGGAHGYAALEHPDVVARIKSLGYDGFLVSEQRELGERYGPTDTIDNLAVFNANQIKTAEPVTRDEAGAVIPLSQRFNPESNSILYKGTVEVVNFQPDALHRSIMMDRLSGPNWYASTVRKIQQAIQRGRPVSLVNDDVTDYGGTIKATVDGKDMPLTHGKIRHSQMGFFFGPQQRQKVEPPAAAAKAPVQSAPASPTIAPATALKLYRTLTAKQETAPLTPGQSKALEQAESSLGQLFLFNDPSTSVLKPADDLVLEQETVNARRPEEQLRLFKSAVDPRLAEAFPNSGFDAYGFPNPPVTLPDDSPLLEETLGKTQVQLPADHPLVAAGMLPAGRDIPRQAFRDAIGAFLMREASPVPAGTQPTVFAMGGGGGAGKSTILAILKTRGDLNTSGAVEINSDDIKLLIPEYQAIVNAGDWRATVAVHEESSTIAKAVLAKATKAGDTRYNVVYDATLADQTKATNLIKGWKDGGYRIHLIGVTIEPREAITRAFLRGKSSGRWVPSTELIKAHSGFNSAVKAYIPLVDAVNLYDNTPPDAHEIAVKTTQNQPISIVNQSLWSIISSRENPLKPSETPAENDRRPGNPSGAETAGNRGQTALREVSAEGQVALAKSKVAPDAGPDLFSFNAGMGLDALLTPAQKEAKVQQAQTLDLFGNEKPRPTAKRPAQPATASRPQKPATQPAGFDDLFGQTGMGGNSSGGGGQRPLGLLDGTGLTGGAGTGGSDAAGGGTTGGTGSNTGAADGPQDGTGSGLSGLQGDTGDTSPRLQSRPAVGSPARNFEPGPEVENLAPTGDRAKILANKEAIILLKKLEDEKRNATTEEKRVLAAYTGWGAFKEAFNKKYEGDIRRYWDHRTEQAKSDYMPDFLKSWEKNHRATHKLLVENMTDEEFDSAAASTLNAHYTAAPIIRAMWRMVERLGFKGGRALEPSAGNGHYLGLQPQGDNANRTHWQTVELDELSARLLAKLYPEAAVNENLGGNEGRSVKGLGFERARIPNGSLDLIISNVPFHESGPSKKGFPTLNLHNFFFGHALDKVKPGGLVAFITSESTMQNNIKQRDFIASKGDLVAAFRLPNNAFKANAGTEVTTDIIIMRKPDGTPFKGQPWRNLVEVGRHTITLKQKDDELVDAFRLRAQRKGAIVREYGLAREKKIDVSAPIMVNEYYVNNPQNVLGQHTLAGTMYEAGAYAVVAPDGMDVMASLNALVPSLPADIMGSQSTADTPDIVLAAKGDKPFSHVERDGKIYEVQPDGSMEEAEWSTSPEAIRTWRSWKGVYEAALELVEASNNANADEKTLAPLRRRLNLLYDTHIAGHGEISKRRTNKHGHLYGDPGFPLTAALEDEVVNLDQKTGKKKYTYKKADILTKRIAAPAAEPKKARDIGDAVAISMAWRGGIQPAFMAPLLNTSIDAINRQLDDIPTVFEDPNTNTYETAETYLSGNLRTKLDAAEEAAKDNPKYDKNVSALRAAWPAPKSIATITPTLGARWIPSSVYNAFIREELNGSDTVEYIPAGNMWTFSGTGLFRSEEHGTERVGPFSLMKHALNMTEPLIYDGSGDDRVLNHSATAAAKVALDKMRAAFVNFVKTSEVPVVREAGGQEMPAWQASEEAFNEINNSYVNPVHTGEYLQFPNLNTTEGSGVRITAFRRSVIARFLSTMRGMMAHGVGSGKTFAQIMLAYEIKRLGKAQKPMIVVQNATLGQFVKSYMQAYPTARLLVPTKDDFKGENRRRLIAKIATGNWDTIIMPHSQFDLIGSKPEAVAAYMDGQIQELYEIMTRTRDESKVRDLQGMLKRLRDRRQKMLDKLAARQDVAMYWEDLGVDAIIMDEAHNYKSLPIVTRMGRVKGVPSSADSQRAINFMLKVRHVQAKMGGKNIFLATGTPIKNSMAEAYIMMQFMAPDILADYKIVNFDDFATTFGQMETKPEMSWSGAPKMESRFVKFQNGGALITMIRSMFDVKFGNEALGLDVPAIQGGEPRMVIVPATPWNERFNAWVRNVGELWKNASGEEKEEFGAAPIQTMAAGIAAALDPRLISPSLPDHPESKVNVAVREVLDIYKSGHERKTTQAIFTDLRNPFTMDYLIPFTGHPFPEYGSDGEFDLYLDIKKKLIAGGMKESEILLMESGFSDKKKSELFDKVNRGEFRVVIGSTELLGVGVNIQERLKAVHHLMPPRDFTPAMQEQRNGRLIRQGNMHSAKVDGQPAWNEPVIINNFGTEKSMDSAIYGALARKQRATTQVLMGEETLDTFDDPTDPGAVNLAEMAARTLGDLDFIRKIELEKEVKDLRLLRDAFADEAGGRKSRLARTETDIRMFPSYIAQVKADQEAQKQRWTRTAPRPEGVRETTDISDKAVYEFDGRTIDTAATKDNAITLPLDLWLQTMSKAMERRGQKRTSASFTVNGNPIFIEVHITNEGQDTPGYVLSREGDNHGEPFRGAASLLMNLHTPDSVYDFKVRSYEQHLADARITAEKLREVIAKAPTTWPDAQKLADLEDEMAEVDARLAAKTAPATPTPSTGGGGSGSGTTVNGVELPEMQAPDPELMTDDVVDAIDNAVIMANRLTLPDTLDRKLYVKVNRALESAGGRWSKKAKAHMFRGDPGPLFGFPPQPAMMPAPTARDFDQDTLPTLQGPPRQAPLAKSSVLADTPTSYESAAPDPFTGIPSLITGPTVSRDQGLLIAQNHAERLRAGLRGGEEKRDAGPALAKDRSRAFVVPILSTAQVDRLQSLPQIGEGGEAKVYADRANGTVYKVLQGEEDSPALGIWPDLFTTADGKLDYVFSPANRPRQLAVRIAVQSLLGGTPTEIVGIGPDGHVILKQPLSSMPDIASRDEYIDAGVRTLAKRQAGLVLIPPGMLADPKAPSTYLAVVEGRPYLVADLVPDNFVGDTQRNARLNDVVVTNLPATLIPRVKGLAAVVTQAGQEAARLGDRANRLFASAKAVTSPMESNEAADQIVTNERLDEWLDTYMMNGWEDAENAIPGGGEEIAKLIAQTRPRNHDRDIHRGVNPNFGEITGRPLYSFSFQKETAQLAGGAGAKVTTKKGPTRYLSAEDIALARIRRDNKPHYAGQQAELFVPASELTTLAKSAVSPSPQVSEPLLSRLGNKILDAADFSMGVTSKVTQAVGLESPLQKLGWNHLDRMASAKLAALTRWTTDKTHVGELVAKWGGHPNAQPFIGLGKGLKRELFPDSVLPREVAARKREMEIKTALGAQRGMDLVRALSGKPKFSDLAYPAEFSQNPMHRRNLYLAMTGEIPMTSLPQDLQDLGGRLRDMLVDMGREAVKQGRMSTDTFANLQSGYMPHYYKEDVQREKSILQRFRLGVRDILAQRTTAWHIVDNDTKDKTGEPRLISWQGNQWRFRNKEHRDAFYEDFILNETLSQVQARGGKAARALTLSDLRAPAKLDAELRGRIKEISLQLKMRYSKERPLDIDEQEKAGLIMDPVYSIARYTAQMVHDNSTAEFFNFVAQNKDWTSDTASPGFTEIPDNPRFGRLAGKYVTEDVSRQILEMVEAPNIALQLYDTILGWWKTGKALALDTPIPTPTGWTTMGELQEGDIIFDECGQPCHVMHATPVMHDHPCYRVSFSDGTNIVADAEHLWATYRGGDKKRLKISTTEEIKVTLHYGPKRWNSHSIPNTLPLQTTTVILPVSPYVLGAWLGDGTSRHANITVGGSDLTAMTEILTAEGVRCGVPRKDKRNEVHTISLQSHGSKRKDTFQSVLRHLGLLGVGLKHIPSVFLRADPVQRLALLQGLMDTDGSISPKGLIEFSTSIPALRDGVLELCRSLGFKPTWRPKSTTAKDNYRILFHADAGLPVFRLPRKLARLKPASVGRRSQTRQITAVEPVESVPVRCIQVNSPNKLYLAGAAMVPTHNTVLNPGTHMRNVLGNVFFSQLAGTSVWNPGNVPYYKAALKAMRNGGPDLQEAYEMGVLGADFVSSELRQTLRQLLPDPATIADDGKPDVLLGIGKAIGRVVPDLLKNPLSKGYNQIAALYQAEDELFKLATYLKAKAMTGTPEAARDHVRTWFPYFDQGTSATLKTLGRTAMPFLGFYRESIRIFGNAVKERPIALATGLAVPSLITFLSAMLLGLDDDDVDQVKKDMRGKAGKLLGPTPFEGMPLFSMLLPVRSDTGQVQQFDISAIHPFVDFLGNRVEATTGQDWYQQMWRSMLAAGPVGSLVYSQMTGKDTFGDRTFVEENMTAMEKIGARADNLAKTILPPLAPGGTGFKTLMSAGERTTNKTFEVRSPVQAVTRAVIGLDVRNATPDLYRMADDWRKANGLPTSEGMDFGGTTPVSRARKALFAQLAQDEPNPQAIGNIKKALTTMGSPIKTPQDVQRLLFYRNPLMIIGGDKTKGLTASDAQQRFRNSLQGLEREALDQAMAEYEKIKAKAPSLLLR